MSLLRGDLFRSILHFNRTTLTGVQSEVALGTVAHYIGGFLLLSCFQNGEHKFFSIYHLLNGSIGFYLYKIERPVVAINATHCMLYVYFKLYYTVQLLSIS